MSKSTRIEKALRNLISFLAMIGPVAASAAPLPGFMLTAQTEHISFYTRGHEKVDTRRVEQYLVRVESALGYSLPTRAEYYRYSSPEELAAGTGTYAGGVTFAQAAQVHSTQEFHAHEIVHLVAGQLGDPGSFFQEGLAVAMGNDGKWNGQAVDRFAKAYLASGSLETLIANFDQLDPQTTYPVAGSFVARLIHTYGTTKVAQFFRSCKGGRDHNAAFAQVFGETLDQAGASWSASL